MGRTETVPRSRGGTGRWVQLVGQENDLDVIGIRARHAIGTDFLSGRDTDSSDHPNVDVFSFRLGRTLRVNRELPPAITSRAVVHILCGVPFYDHVYIFDRYVL